MFQNEGLLERIAHREGAEGIDELIGAYMLDSSVLCVCTNCEAIADDTMEPDAEGEFCDECCQRSVTSVLRIAGII